ncbi:MAG TPA: DUF1549 and DUF1553 domain-containing protein [Gemmataceae bacterium]|nr:DUF1549 and DUF1553 domain-containing protein [Gemmataceae bacterium]
MRVSVFALTAVFLAASPAPATDRSDPAALAKRIDRHVLAKLSAAGVPPAPLADDAMFLRRTYLLLVGRVPMPSEVYAFLEDRDPNKRATLIDRLLASPGYANHFTAVWRGWLIPEAMTRYEVAALVPGFDAWLRKKLVENTPYDKFATELLTASLTPPRNTPNQFLQPIGEDAVFGMQGPLAFYYAKDAKPENLAAATARVFLGVQIECAQCHDHPFARWSRDQFWGLAAFFAGVEKVQPNNDFGPLREVLDRRELAIPNTDQVLQATFLDDTEPEWKPGTSSRTTLAAWITARDNRFFARAAVNRMWGYVFGTGIVDPIDDFNDENKPSHPELLDELAKEFAASGYDLRFLIKAILLSETYQHDSALADPKQANPRLFARFPVQALTPEQLYDSLALIASAGQEPAGQYLVNPGSPKRQFLDKFAIVGAKTEAPTSILQSLTLMNGELVAVATDPDKSRPVMVVVGLPGLTDEDRVEILYLTALGRKPKPAEMDRALRHVRADPTNPKKRYGDLLWALLNSAEFRTNH